MRPIHLTDLDQVVRSVIDLETHDRHCKLDEIIRRADIADRYRKRFKRPHPIFGTGRLGSAIDRPFGPSVTFCDEHYRTCLRDLLERLAAS